VSIPLRKSHHQQVIRYRYYSVSVSARH